MDASDLMDRCGARTHRGGICKARAMANGRCQHHGGKSTGPRTLTAGGRYSKFLPRRLAARYEEALLDGELLSLRDDLAVLDARLCELLQGLDSDEVAAQWGQALKVWEGAKAATTLNDTKKRAEYFRELDGLLSRGANMAAQWSEIAQVMEQRRRLAETETRRLAHLQQFLTAQQANMLVAALIRVVEDHVPDTGTRTQIAVELARLLNRPAPIGPGPD